MADISFIKLHPNKDVAQDLGESPHANLRYLSQIQLLSFDPQPYTQVTSSPIPLTFDENYKVYLVRCRDLKEFEATDHFDLRQTDDNEQIIMQIAYLPFDFQMDSVYIHIDRYGDGLKNYYSNKFLVTRINENLTSRIDYIDLNNKVPSAVRPGSPLGIYQSIRLAFYFNNEVTATDVDTYYQITTSKTINPRISVKEYKEWATQIFNAWTFLRLSRSFYFGKCYINQYRNYPIEGLEYQKREGRSNISESLFVTAQDNNDMITIIPVIIDPGYTKTLFLASSSEPSSTSALSSQQYIYIPTP